MSEGIKMNLSVTSQNDDGAILSPSGSSPWTTRNSFSVLATDAHLQYRSLYRMISLFINIHHSGYCTFFCLFLLKGYPTSLQCNCLQFIISKVGGRFIWGSVCLTWRSCKGSYSSPALSQYISTAQVLPWGCWTSIEQHQVTAESEHRFFFKST